MSVPLLGVWLAFGSAALGAQFVAADAALSSLTTARVAALLEQDDASSRATLLRYQKDSATFHSTYLVGRVACAVMTALFLASEIGTTGAALWQSAALSLLIYAPISAAATALAIEKSETWGLWLAGVLRPFEWVLWPFAHPLAWLGESLSNRAAEVETPAERDVASAEVEHFVDEVERSGVVGRDPAEIIRNVLEFEDRRARDIMIPRSRIEGIEVSTALQSVRQLVAESGHSRYPVYQKQLDNVVGLLVAKDVFKGDVGQKSLSDVMRKDVIFVHEAQKLVTLLREMRSKSQHLVVVVDEFGGTRGIVTLEDVIEEIVGDIRDEHDEVESSPSVQPTGDGRWTADANLSLRELSQFIGLASSTNRERTPLAALFPEGTEGEKVEFPGLELWAKDVRDGVPTRVDVVRVDSTTPPPAD